MTLVSISLPPGVFANGTLYQAKGRYCAANLIRFSEGSVKPVGGWQLRSADASAFSGAARAVTAWTDNSGSRWIAAGTSSHLYVQDEGGTNTDITPTGFTAGNDNATQNIGYGGGPYGHYDYGAPRPNTVAYDPATVWTLDSWGENLVGCSDTDGKLYEWAPQTPTAPAAAITGAPPFCKSLVVTGEGFLFALGGGKPGDAHGDGRSVQWCDQQNDAVWTPAATNQAGDFDLPTAGTLMAGRALTGQTLLLTDVDAWTATYLGAPLVYGFQKSGSGCGLIARGAVAALDAEAVWMGSGGFWRFDGQTVQPLDCDVADAVFGDLNLDQVSKATAVLLGGPGEVWWFYPSSSSTENDRYVAWAYRESRRLGRNVWTTGQLTRLAGAGKSVGRTPPLMTDRNGHLYEHETGLNYDGAQPYLETGPIEIGMGEYIAEVQMVIPDQFGDGEYEATFFTRMWPDGPEATAGPYPLVSPTFLLLQAAQIRVRLGLLNTQARPAIGNLRLSVERGDRIDSATFAPDFTLDYSTLDGPNVLS